MSVYEQIKDNFGYLDWPVAAERFATLADQAKAENGATSSSSPASSKNKQCNRQPPSFGSTALCKVPLQTSNRGLRLRLPTQCWSFVRLLESGYSKRLRICTGLPMERSWLLDMGL